MAVSASDAGTDESSKTRGRDMEFDHVDYPHAPGTLYGCLSCERECYCDAELGSMECLHCALEAQAAREELQACGE